MNSNNSALVNSTAIPDSASIDHLRQLEHFAELGRLSASLLHEISNPLAAALLYLEQYDSRQSHSIRHVHRNILLLQRYVEAARQQIRREGKVSSFYVHQQVDQVRRILTPLARRKGVNLQIQPGTNHKLFGDPVKFQQILANLVANAIDAYDTMSAACPNKSVTVTLANKRQWLFVQVADKGSGIPAERLAHVFEPFYTTKSQHAQGLGIGLAIVKRYVERDFGGSVSVISSPERGTEFTAKLRTLPRYKA